MFIIYTTKGAENMDSKKKNPIVQPIIWIMEGILIGFGAILPGISGGALLVAFGMYKPIIDLLSNPFKNIKKYSSFVFHYSRSNY